MTGAPRRPPGALRWRRLAGVGSIALLQLELLTGRTHQIRVHLKHTDHPLVGDPPYGEPRWKGLPGPRQAPARLSPPRAARLAPHSSASGGRCALHTFEAPVPDDLVAAVGDGEGDPLPALPTLGRGRMVTWR